MCLMKQEIFSLAKKGPAWKPRRDLNHGGVIPLPAPQIFDQVHNHTSVDHVTLFRSNVVLKIVLEE